MPDKEIFETANGFPSPSGLHRIDQASQARGGGNSESRTEDGVFWTDIDQRISHLTSNDLAQVNLKQASDLLHTILTFDQAY